MFDYLTTKAGSWFLKNQDKKKTINYSIEQAPTRRKTVHAIVDLKVLCGNARYNHKFISAQTLTCKGCSNVLERYRRGGSEVILLQ